LLIKERGKLGSGVRTKTWTGYAASPRLCLYSPAHKSYMDELAKIIQHFTTSDFILKWVKEYEESLDILMDSIG
jgi:hypothetical protein